MYLSHLPPELLATITSDFDALDVAALFLAGDKALNARLRSKGVKQWIYSPPPKERVLWPSMSSYFPYLELFCVNYPDEKMKHRVEGVDIRSIPKNVLEIKLLFVNSLDFLLQMEELLDAQASSAASLSPLPPNNYELFPRLETLVVKCGNGHLNPNFSSSQGLPLPKIYSLPFYQLKRLEIDEDRHYRLPPGLQYLSCPVASLADLPSSLLTLKARNIEIHRYRSYVKQQDSMFSRIKNYCVRLFATQPPIVSPISRESKEYHEGLQRLYAFIDGDPQMRSETCLSFAVDPILPTLFPPNLTSLDMCTIDDLDRHLLLPFWNTVSPKMLTSLSFEVSTLWEDWTPFEIPPHMTHLSIKHSGFVFGMYPKLDLGRVVKFSEFGKLKSFWYRTLSMPLPIELFAGLPTSITDLRLFAKGLPEPRDLTLSNVPMLQNLKIFVMETNDGAASTEFDCSHLALSTLEIHSNPVPNAQLQKMTTLQTLIVRSSTSSPLLVSCLPPTLTHLHLCIYQHTAPIALAQLPSPLRYLHVDKLQISPFMKRSSHPFLTHLSCQIEDITYGRIRALPQSLTSLQLSTYPSQPEDLSYLSTQYTDPKPTAPDRLPTETQIQQTREVVSVPPKTSRFQALPRGLRSLTISDRLDFLQDSEMTDLPPSLWYLYLCQARSLTSACLALLPRELSRFSTDKILK